MSKKLALGLIVLALTGALVGAFCWRAEVSSRQAGALVGEWSVEHRADLDDAVRAELVKDHPGIAADEKLRAHERMYFARDGTCRHVQTLLGQRVTSEGTWTVTGIRETRLRLRVKLRQQTLSVRPHEGGTALVARDGVVE